MLTPFGSAPPIFPKSGTKEIETVVVMMPTDGGGAIYSVESGRYPNRTAAAEAAAQLESRADVSAVIVPAPPLPKTAGSQ